MSKETADLRPSQSSRDPLPDSIEGMIKLGITPPYLSNQELRECRVYLNPGIEDMHYFLLSATTLHYLVGHRDLCRYAAKIALGRMMKNEEVLKYAELYKLVAEDIGTCPNPLRRSQCRVLQEKAKRVYKPIRYKAMDIWLWCEEDAVILSSFASSNNLPKALIGAFMADALSEIKEAKFGSGDIAGMKEEYQHAIADLSSAVVELTSIRDMLT